MNYRILMIATAIFLLVCGAAFAGWGPMLLLYFWLVNLPLPVDQNLPLWSAMAFTRLFGASLMALGTVAAGLRNLTQVEDHRRVAIAFFLASVLILIIALTQQIAIWSTIAGWIIVELLTILTASFGGLLLSYRKAPSFNPTIPAQNPEKMREQWAREIHEAAAQQERNRLARDLHDSIKQQIFSISVSAATAQTRWESDREGAQTAIEDVRKSAREAMAEMEAMLQHLRPTPLENVGLVEALRKQCEALQYRTGAKVTTEFNSVPDNETFLPGTQDAIFRIAQEALNNVARHARAENVRIRLYQPDCEKPPLIWLKIEDDGKGYDTSQINDGMGLANIRARVAEIGGRLQIKSLPGQGTSLMVSIPLILPDVNRIKRRLYGWNICGFAFALLTGILIRFGITGWYILFLWSLPLTAMMFFMRRKDDLNLEVDKLISMKQVPLNVSMGLRGYRAQQKVFFNAALLWLIIRIQGGPIYLQAALYFNVVLFVLIFGSQLLLGLRDVHRLMKELREKLSAVDFKQSISQMRKQTTVALIIGIPVITTFSWWAHDWLPLGFIGSLLLYMGYITWWESKTRKVEAPTARSTGL